MLGARTEVSNVNIVAKELDEIDLLLFAIGVQVFDLNRTTDASADYLVPHPHELVNIHASPAHHSCLPASGAVALVCDPLDDNRIDRVVLVDQLHGLDHLADLLGLSLAPPQDVVDVVDLATLLVALVVKVADARELVHLAQLLLLLVHQLVLVEEADQLALARLQDNLTGKLVDSEALYDVKDVYLEVQLRLCVLLNPVLAPWLNPATKAASMAEFTQHETAAVLVREELSVDDRSVQPRLEVLV